MASTNRDEISRLELLHAAHPDGLVFPHLADAYRRAGRYAQAESVLNAGLRRHQNYSSAHVVLGRLRLDQGKRRQAENAFQRVLQLDPENHVALEFLGKLAADEGRKEEALGYLRRLARLKPDEELAERIATFERDVQEAESARTAAKPARTLAASRVDADRGGAEGQEAPPPSQRRSNGGEGGTSPGATAGDGVGRPLPPTAEADGPEELPEPGEVVTETMAELYTRQGLHDRAEAVYRQLYERDPSNARLKARLEEAVGRRDPTESGAPEAEPWSEAPVTEAPPPRESIGDYLSGVLDWTPAAEGETAPPMEAPSSSEHLSSSKRPASAGEASPAVEPPSREETPAPEGPSPTKDASPAEEPSDSSWEPWAEAPVSERSEPEQQPPAQEPAQAPATPPPATPPPATPEAPPKSRPGTTAEDLGLEEDTLEGAGPETRALIALTDMLVGLLEYRDPFFRGSSSLTRLLATNVAKEMGLDAPARVSLALAAVLRDLGRLALGGKLVESQETSKTPEARRRIERHVDLALHLMEGIDLPKAVMLAVRHHHERWDGGGYPDGLAGTDIPLLARVLAAVDSFAAMVSPRPYRLPRKVPEAAAEMREAAGTQYDPQVVDALLRVLERRDQPHLGFVQRHHILLVNPDQPGAVVTAAKLCSAGYLAEVAVDADTARERLRRVPVAALVVSAEAGAEAAEELVQELRLDPLFASLPIVVVDAETVALRVRLLESGADVCFPPGISHGELQGTLGALVRRTLRSRNARSDDEDEEAPWLALQGDVQDFPLAWLLQVMKYDSRTAAIGIRTATEQGAIYIEDGDAVHAQIRGGANGEAALKTMLQWRKGRFTVQPDARPRERSIDSSIMHLLLTQAVEEDHAAAGIFGAVSDSG